MRAAFLIILLVLGAIWTLFVLGLWTAFAVGSDLLRWMIAPDLSVLPAPESFITFAGWLWAIAMFVMWSVGAATLALIAFVVWRARAATIVFQQARMNNAGMGPQSWSPGGRPMRDVTPGRSPGDLPPN